MHTEQEGTNHGGRLWPESQSPPLPPAPAGTKSSLPWRAFAAVAGILLVVASLANVVSTRESTGHGAGAGSTTIAPSPAGTLGGAVDVQPPTPDTQSGESESTDTTTGISATDETPLEVLGSFNSANGWTRGRDLRFGVIWLAYPWKRCFTHTFSLGGKPRGAFYADCAWDRRDYAFFRVNFKNTSDQPMTLRPEALTLLNHDGRTVFPVNVGAVKRFLSRPLSLSSGAQWTGWVAFDNSGLGIDPVSMSYFDSSQTLTQLFQGTASVFPPR